MTEIRLRPARPDDKPVVVDFTTNTFAWGDYIERLYDAWLDDPAVHVVAAVDPDDVPVGLGRAALLSPQEAWVAALRVRTERRRQGIASAVTNHLTQWAKDAGAQVARMIVEGWNEPSQALAESCGFRRTGEWQMADRPTGAASPVSSGNGGRRVAAAEKLRPAPSSEAEPAFVAWSGGDLARAARGLYAIGWTWRRLGAEDLAEAATRHALWEARTGWALAAVERDTFRVSWLHTGPEDSHDLIRALIDQAEEEGADRLEVMSPEVPWLTRSLRRLGLELHPLALYARPLT